LKENLAKGSINRNQVVTAYLDVLSMDDTLLIKKKICLLGSFAVGKTSLVERFVYNRFDEKYLTTIGVRVSQKILPPIRNPESGQRTQFNLLIWDIERIEKFNSVVRNYYRGAAGALAVADVTRPETISTMQEIGDTFCSVSPTAQLLIVGNKLDIFEQDKRTLSLLKKTASHFSTEYFLSSAKTGEQVEDVFMMLAKKLDPNK
jgi:small GTP-binding protein